MASKNRHKGKAIWRKNRNLRREIQRRTEKRRLHLQRMATDPVYGLSQAA